MSRNFALAGDTTSALMHLGMALHPTMDVFGPFHTDENGCPKVWDPFSLDAVRHSINEPRTPVDPKSLDKMPDLIQRAFGYVFGV